MALFRPQAGNTLITALVMLTLLTLISVAALNMSTTNVQIVGNMQFRTEAELAAQQAINNIMDTIEYTDNPFTTVAPTDRTVDIDRDGEPDYNVSFDPAPSCIRARPVDTSVDDVPSSCYGGSGLGDVDLCFWTTWDLAATATNDVTNATATVHQGVDVLTGLNGALAFCGV